MLRFGLLGAGRIGQVHGRNIAGNARARLVALADADAGAAKRLSDATGAAVRPLEDILTAKDVDAILIATPTDTHADLIEAVAANGKAILCEKPVSLSVERIETCLEAVARAKVPLMIGFHRRYDPNFAALEKRLRAGEIGDIEMVTIVCRDPAPPPVSYITRSGGIFRDMTIHDFDMARFLLADEPVVVHAMGGVLVDPAIGEAGDIDTAAVHMQTKAGRICVITGSRRATYGHDQRIEVHGSKGMLRAGNTPLTTVELASGQGFTGDLIPFSFVERYEEAYRRELDAFIDAIAKGRAPRADGRDGLMAQKLAEAATASWKSGNAVKVA